MKRILMATVTTVFLMLFCVSAFAVQPRRRSECDSCGKFSVVTQTVGGYTEGPYETDCIHYSHGSDEIYYKYTTYQDVCGSCRYAGPQWSVQDATRRICHGWN